jgi:hypothetical protein
MKHMQKHHAQDAKYWNHVTTCKKTPEKKNIRKKKYNYKNEIFGE